MKLTDAQIRTLRFLRSSSTRGSKSWVDGRIAAGLERLGYIASAAEGRRKQYEYQITTAGLAALAEHERMQTS